MNNFFQTTTQINDVKLNIFFEDFTKNSIWVKEIEEMLQYQKSAFLATAEDCHLIDHSFYFEDSNGICFFPVHLINQNLSFLNLPIDSFTLGKPNISPSMILNKFREIIKTTKAKKVLLSYELAEYLKIQQSFILRNLKVAQIDLTQDEDLIFKAMSKGHKSSVRSGQKILTTSLFNAHNFSQSHFVQLIELYSTVAKRNKSDQYWQLVKNAILENSAFFTLATFEAKPASCQLFFNGNTKVSYALAAYDRELMAQGLSLSHWPLFYAILESKKQGFKIFELGYVLEDNEDEKVQSIFKFKSNFVSDLKFSTFYEVTATEL